MSIPADEVAAVYIAAGESGLAPTLAVARRFNISPSTAGKWVMRARREGLLPPTSPGVALPVARHPKVVRLAQALGVTYDRLMSAVMDTCGGDLRIPADRRWWDMDTKMASRLGCPISDVRQAALELYGHQLLVERTRRAPTGAPRGVLGQVSRQLRAELKEHLNEKEPA